MLADEATRENTAVNAGSDTKSPPEKIVYWLLGFLVLYAVIRNAAAAAIKPFFFDELITLAVASQPNIKDIWRSLAQAVDSHPPLFYLLERVALGLVKNKHIALRLFPILGLPLTFICIFVYLRRKNTEVVAFLGATLLLLTSLYHTYAIDARAYSMVILCIAFALLCYQRVPSLFWTAMLGLSLALAESLHYYAIFSMLPFWVAEAVYFLKERRFRWQVWAALALGFVPLIVLWPLLSNVRAYYGAHIWTHYGLANIPITYGSFFLTAGAFGFAIVSVCVAGVVGARLLLVNRLSGAGAERDPVEAALLLAFVALPFPTALATNLMHGAMVERYVLATILGLVICVTCALSLARKGVVELFALFVFSAICLHELAFWSSVHSLYLENPADSIESLVKKAGHPDLPVVVPDGLRYLQLAYYASPEWKERFVFLVDEQKAVEYSGTDSIDKNFVVLRRYMPLHLDDFSGFVARHPRFLLYEEDPGAGFDWLPGYLTSTEASVRALVVQPTRKLYLVTMEEDSPH